MNVTPYRLTPAAPVPVADLYFYPLNKPGSPILHIKSDTATKPSGYLFQLLDDNGCVQAQTFHMGLADALAQVVARMRIEGLPDYRVGGF